jgi:SAM-dependent methyltransferase
VPIDAKRERTFEDPGVTDPRERARLFGQSDHVRWYGRDYPQRLAAAGFEVSVLPFHATFSAEDIARHGLGAGEDLYVCRRGAAPAATAGADAAATPAGVELPLPPAALRFMNETDARFHEIGAMNLGILRAHGFGPDTRLLDIGCGYGRLPIAVARAMAFRGEYLGVDILPRHVQWCRDTLTPRLPNLRFEVLDIRNDRYNPKGRYDARDYRFPLPDGHFEMCCLFSVFTHMYEAEIGHYLDEIARLLAPGGLGVATFFLMDETRRARVTDPANTLAMGHVLDDHTRYHNAADPLHAIAYERDYACRLVEARGLRIRECSYGSWAGGDNGAFQDRIVFER